MPSRNFTYVVEEPNKLVAGVHEYLYKRVKADMPTLSVLNSVFDLPVKVTTEYVLDLHWTCDPRNDDGLTSFWYNLFVIPRTANHVFDKKLEKKVIFCMFGYPEEELTIFDAAIKSLTGGPKEKLPVIYGVDVSEDMTIDKLEKLLDILKY